MHPQVMSFLEVVTAPEQEAQAEIAILELGSRDVNGSPRSLFPNALRYHGVDAAPGDGVDEVADAANYRTFELFDLVLCTEVLEHCENWREIVKTAWRCLKLGGTAVFTAACDPRLPHSAIDGGEVRLGEYYANVSVADLDAALLDAGFSLWELEYEAVHGDVRAHATKLSWTAKEQGTTGGSFLPEAPGEDQ